MNKIMRIKRVIAKDGKRMNIKITRDTVGSCFEGCGGYKTTLQRSKAEVNQHAILLSNNRGTKRW